MKNLRAHAAALAIWWQLASSAFKVALGAAAVAALLLVGGEIRELLVGDVGGALAPGGPLEGRETRASRRAASVEYSCVPTPSDPTAPPGPARPLIVKRPRAADVPALERRSGVDLDRDGRIDGKRWRLPAIEGTAAPAGDQVAAAAPPKGDLLKEERFDVRGRGALTVGAYWLDSGEVDLVGAPAPRVEWLHQVELELAGVLDPAAAFAPRTDDFRAAVRWTPARLGPAYPFLGASYARHGELLEQLDRAAAALGNPPELDELRRDLAGDLRLEVGVSILCRGLPWPGRCSPR